jgi:hypothetical protein
LSEGYGNDDAKMEMAREMEMRKEMEMKMEMGR